MSTPDLPPDLAELERHLERLHRQGPPAGLRERVLSAVRRDARPDGGGGFWRFAAAVAAAAVLLINLSMSAANNTDWRLAADFAPDGRVGVSEGADTSEKETQRQALLARGRARLTPGGAIATPSPSLRLFSGD